MLCSNNFETKIISRKVIKAGTSKNIENQTIY
jgi:hypothetical protein